MSIIISFPFSSFRGFVVITIAFAMVDAEKHLLFGSLLEHGCKRPGLLKFEKEYSDRLRRRSGRKVECIDLYLYLTDS